MRKFVTHDGQTIRIKVESDEVADVLNNIIPRLSYDEILDGELEKRLEEFDINSIKLSSGEDIKKLIFSLTMFNTVSKAPGF